MNVVGHGRLGALLHVDLEEVSVRVLDGHLVHEGCNSFAWATPGIKLGFFIIIHSSLGTWRLGNQL